MRSPYGGSIRRSEYWIFTGASLALPSSRAINFTGLHGARRVASCKKHSDLLRARHVAEIRDCERRARTQIRTRDRERRPASGLRPRVSRFLVLVLVIIARSRRARFFFFRSFFRSAVKFFDCKINRYLSKVDSLATAASRARARERGVTYFLLVGDGVRFIVHYYESADGQISFCPRAKRHTRHGNKHRVFDLPPSLSLSLSLSSLLP